MSYFTEETQREAYAQGFMEAMIRKHPPREFIPEEEMQKLARATALGAVVYADALIKALEENRHG